MQDDYSRTDSFDIAKAKSDSPPIKIGVIGDSLATYNGYAQYLDDVMRERGWSVEIDNQGQSGATSSYGPRAAQAMISDGNIPDIVVLELGGNDLRSRTPPNVIKGNLQETIDILRGAGVTVVLSGMQAPESLNPRIMREYGISSAQYEQYRDSFNAIYPDLAEQNGLILDPLIYENVIANPNGSSPREIFDQQYMSDDVHFNDLGARVTAEGLVEELEDAATSLGFQPSSPMP